MARRHDFGRVVAGQPPHWLLEVIKTVPDSDPRFHSYKVLGVAHEIYARLNFDLSKLEKDGFSKVVFGNVAANYYSGKTSEIVKRWDEANYAPSLTSIVYSAFRHWNVDLNASVSTPEGQMVRAVLMNAVLADVQHQNGYHDNPHFRNVDIDGLHLAARRGFDKNKMLMLLWVLTKHDLGHKGRVQNLDNGQHVALLEEQHTIDFTEPYERASGVSENLIKDSQVAVMGTDVSGGDMAPANIVYDMYRHYFMDGDLPDFSDFPEKARVAMSRLEGRPDLVEITKIAQVADLFIAVGRDFDTAVLWAANLEEEMQMLAHGKSSSILTVNPNAQVGFRNCPIITSLFDLPEMEQFRETHDSIIEAFECDAAAGHVYCFDRSSRTYKRDLVPG